MKHGLKIEYLKAPDLQRAKPSHIDEGLASRWQMRRRRKS